MFSRRYKPHEPREDFLRGVVLDVEIVLLSKHLL